MEQWVEQLLRQHAPHLRQEIGEMIPRDFRADLSADDVLQDVWVEAFLAASRLRLLRGAEVFRWLRVVTRNKVLNAVKSATSLKRGGVHRAGQFPGFETDAPSLAASECLAHLKTPSRIMMNQELADAVQQAMAHLPEDQQKAVRLRLDGCSFQEIGHALHRSDHAARSLAFRGFQVLRSCLPQLGQFLSDA